MFAEYKHDRSVTFKQLRSHHGVTELKFVADDHPAEKEGIFFCCLTYSKNILFLSPCILKKTLHNQNSF